MEYLEMCWAIAQLNGMANEQTTGTTMDMVGCHAWLIGEVTLKRLDRLTNTPHISSNIIPMKALSLTLYL